MLPDIHDIDDIKLLVDTFYDKVKADGLIGYIFNDIARVDWPAHLPVMYNFWDSVIFNKGSYKGNAIAAHNGIHAKEPFTKAHFERWLQLFTKTVDELFAGEKAETAKQRAASIATIMQLKLIYHHPLTH
ncbi:group III truncated hemoglobin [Panacibacter sp. DH6]|uniref:Group III truncated hemoglobin n=1 Tax=Panacibacter microcysteis TaxID=2793269 RepID=A0A931E8X6_9BACT|nr:group III truncated hemoglobin [Panacibacter microcysteis]MBG9375886.1 group III truncated hemoglobin [Panacibacter microcysteis]